MNNIYDKLISVVVPFYKTEDSLMNECINSVLNQTYKNYEIIIVDDGSGESYVKELEKYRNNKSIKIHSFIEHQGVSAARNYGTKISNGEYITYLDSDDKISKCFLEESFLECVNNNADIVIGCNIMSKTDNIFLNCEGKGNNKIIFNNTNKTSILPYLISNKTNKTGIPIGRGCVCRLVKANIAKNVFFDEELKIGEDILWNISIIMKSNKIIMLEKYWYYYRCHNLSTVHKYNENRLMESEKLLKKIDQYKNNNNEIETAYLYLLLEHMQGVFENYISFNWFNIDKRKKKNIYNVIYNKYPWIEINNKEFYKRINIKDKLFIICYKTRLLWLFVITKKIYKVIKE